jgi:hypothetical protein
MKSCKMGIAILILLNLSLNQALLSQPTQEHIVPREEFHTALVEQSEQRLANIHEVRKLLHHELVQKRIGNLVDLDKIEVAVATLDNETLEQLARQSREANDQIQAGVSTWVIVVLIIVAAVVIAAIAINPGEST